ncbi:hypothetical protein E1293_06640 [Actinomadura darangshiensis]|uniref:Uncharacterized protein n=1 Tax=Actinomadura darangshiensis TaxID=705336 RepID=A0A4R5BRZ0_9ACTN|nr:hypothetical protein [Actinomadura darangshiensis]TDD88326.1 hypothetical protein E1293_06640 [Actinomadura darangshiensis]
MSADSPSRRDALRAGDPWREVPRILRRVRPPRFPGRHLTGPIHLLSRVDLHVGECATILITTDPAAYLPMVTTRWVGTECYNHSPFILVGVPTDHMSHVHLRKCDFTRIKGPDSVQYVDDLRLTEVTVTGARV